ncbi:MAG: hypothetical protein DMG06_10190 [Acidobacteria bacterium]|nr:MAG: hypothetical protein DMG06_10190 [Acidobacteriota bacterium]
MASQTVPQTDKAVPKDVMNLIQTSEIKMAEGRYPSQIVLREVKPGTFATHIKVLPPDADPYFILGRYFFRLEEAEADFHKRIKELEGPQNRK